MWQQTKIWYHCQNARFKKCYQSATWLRIAQQQKIRQLLTRISCQIEFYRPYQGVAFQNFPIINKTFMQQHFKQFNRYHLSQTEALSLATQPRSFLHVQQSKGTTGDAGLYLFSLKEVGMAVGDLLSKMTSPSLYEKQKFALFHLSPTAYMPPVSAWGWQCFNLNQDFAQLCSALQKFQPDVLVAPVQTLCQLALLQRANKINLSLKKVVATAEVLTPLEESIIATTFAQKVDQLYQCAEGWLGTTCQYGTLHINENLYYVEKQWIDEQKRRFIPVITTLNRFVQPLIRYRMEDIMTLKATCPCGNIFLGVEKIVGRCEDILYFQEQFQQQFLKPIYSDELSQAIEQAGGGIKKYQLVQHSPHYIVIKLQADQYLLAQRFIQQQLDKLWQKEKVTPPTLAFVELQEVSLNQMFRKTQRLGTQLGGH